MQENYIDKQVSYLFERMIYWYDLINLLTPVSDVIHGVLKHFFKNQHSCYIYSILTCMQDIYMSTCENVLCIYWGKNLLMQDTW